MICSIQMVIEPRFERIWALSSYKCILTEVGKWTVILSIACMSLEI